MMKNTRSFLLLALFALITSLSHGAHYLEGSPGQQKENSTWHLYESKSISTAIEKYLSTKNLEPLFKKEKINFYLEGFESHSGPRNCALPIGKISQQGKNYYAMFCVEKENTTKLGYKVNLVCISNELPPSIILLLDILAQIMAMSNAYGENIDNSNILIEQLEFSKQPVMISSKWTLFQADKNSTYYVVAIADEKGETDFSVSKTPIRP